MNYPLNGCARGSRPVLLIIRPLLFPIIISIAVCGFDEKKRSQSPPEITIKIVIRIIIPNTRFIHLKTDLVKSFKQVVTSYQICRTQNFLQHEIFFTVFLSTLTSNVKFESVAEACSGILLNFSFFFDQA